MFVQTVLMALREIRRNTLRSVLTMLGVLLVAAGALLVAGCALWLTFANSASAQILPPCFSTMLLVIARPSPVPGVLPLIPPLAW